jgi:hypothetical protein
LKFVNLRFHLLIAELDLKGPVEIVSERKIEILLHHIELIIIYLKNDKPYSPPISYLSEHLFP